MKGNMGPSRGSGSNRGLTFGSRSADRAGMGSSWNSQGTPGGATRSRERGQALVEFALILPLFLLIVVGVIQFGVGLNYWLDLNRIANQGARWAVVDKWPDCPSNPGCSLEEHMELQHTSRGNDNDVFICFEVPTPLPSATSLVGQPVRVTATSEYGFQAIMDMASITLRGRATMRVEQPPVKLLADGVDSCQVAPLPGP
jgi:TadE-like protein